MYRILLLSLLLTMATTAMAEVRFINSTGQDLKIDVLHKNGQVHDVAVSAEPTYLPPIGVPLPKGEEVMVVLKSSDGVELFREKVNTGEISIIIEWTPYLFSMVGEFKHERPRGSRPRLVNLTGQEITVKATSDDFSISNEKVPARDSRGNIAYRDLSMLSGKVDFELGFEGQPATVKHSLAGGQIYLATRDSDGSLKIERIGSY